MKAPQLDSAHRRVAGAADVVQRLADLVRAIADSVSLGGSGLGDLATAIDSLADQARTAAYTIDRCLALANGRPDRGASPSTAGAQYDLAAQCTAMLEYTLDAAVAIWRRACSELADHVALAEEHELTIPSADGQRLSAAVLSRHARALAQVTARP